MWFIVFKMASRWNDDLDDLMWTIGWISWKLIKHNLNPHIINKTHHDISIWWLLEVWIYMLNTSFNSLGSSEQDETISSLGWSEQHSWSLGIWSNKTLIPKTINVNPSMHIHLPIGLFHLGKTSFYLQGNMSFIMVYSKQLLKPSQCPYYLAIIGIQERICHFNNFSAYWTLWCLLW